MLNLLRCLTGTDQYIRQLLIKKKQYVRSKLEKHILSYTVVLANLEVLARSMAGTTTQNIGTSWPKLHMSVVSTCHMSSGYSMVLSQKSCAHHYELQHVTT